jgi:hypothetical protein
MPAKGRRVIDADARRQGGRRSNRLLGRLGYPEASRARARTQSMIRHSTQPGSPVVEITVEGTITNKDLEETINELQSGFDQDGKTRVIEIIQHFTGMELAALWTDVRLGVPLAKKVERVAVVADQKWIRQLAELGHLFTRAELKVFALDELAQARAWIVAG